MEENTQLEDASNFPGVPDAFNRFWTPYRMAYIRGDSHPRNTLPKECPFCAAPQKSDAEGLIVHHGKKCFVVMNLFPYNSGHLLVCPYRHVSDFTDLTSEERIEISDLTVQAMNVERAVSHPQGFNIGMNQGNVAGAGIAGHLHQHIVPRWEGDINFLPIIARTKAIPELLEDGRITLANAWGKYAYKII